MRHGLCVFLMLAAAMFAPAAQTSASFDYTALPDTNESRTRFLTSLVTANWNSAVLFSPTKFNSASGPVHVGIERREDFFYVQFLRERDGGFPLASPGNTVVQRNYQRNGDLIQAKLFLSEDPSCYIRLYPYSERTKADIILYGAVVRQGLVIPKLFYYLLRDHVSAVILQTRSGFEWESLYRAPGPESESRAFGRALREGRIYGGSAAGQLVSSLIQYDAPEEFLAARSRFPGTEELTEGLPLPYADDSDPLQTAQYRPFPAYSSGRGVPLPAASALAHAEARNLPGNILAAFVQDGGHGRRLFLIAGFDARGVFGIEAYDPGTRTFMDWPAYVAAHRTALVRLVRVPLP